MGGDRVGIRSLAGQESRRSRWVFRAKCEREQITRRPPGHLLPQRPRFDGWTRPSFEPQLNTVTASYSVNFLVAGGRRPPGPSLSLSYSPGLPNGPFGPGWALGVSVISRQTAKGRPTYWSADTYVDGIGPGSRTAR